MDFIFGALQRTIPGFGSLRKEAYKAKNCPVDKPEINKRSSRIRGAAYFIRTLTWHQARREIGQPYVSQKIHYLRLEMGPDLISNNKFGTI